MCMPDSQFLDKLHHAALGICVPSVCFSVCCTNDIHSGNIVQIKFTFAQPFVSRTCDMHACKVRCVTAATQQQRSVRKCLASVVGRHNGHNHHNYVSRLLSNLCCAWSCFGCIDRCIATRVFIQMRTGTHQLSELVARLSLHSMNQRLFSWFDHTNTDVQRMKHQTELWILLVDIWNGE